VASTITKLMALHIYIGPEAESIGYSRCNFPRYIFSYLLMYQVILVKKWS